MDAEGKVNDVGLWNETTLYRYLPIDRFLEIIETEKNTFVHVSKWEDPNEAYLIRRKIAEESRNGDSEAVQEWYNRYRKFYGQSWTFNGKESDVLWRAYGSRGDTVRIMTTVKGLRSALESFVRKKSDYLLSAYIGPISYVKNTNVLLQECDMDIVKTLFVKRGEFMDENEFRVVVKVDNSEDNVDKDDSRLSTIGGLLKFDVVVSDLINSVLVDPCCSPRRMDEIRCRMMNAGCDIKISQSTLFEWPGSERAPQCLSSGAVSNDREEERVTLRQSEEIKFWKMFTKKYRGGKSEFSGRRPPDRRYWGFPVGSGVSYFVVFNRDYAKVELYIDSPNKSWNEQFLGNMKSTLASKHPELKFDPLEMKRASRISIANMDLKFTDKTCWAPTIDWLCKSLDELRGITEPQLERFISETN